MKRFLLAVIAVALFASSTSFVEAFTSEQQNIIDRVVTRRHARQPATLLESRTQKIIDRINDLQMRARLTEEATAILNYVEVRLTNIINALHDRPLIPTSSNTTTNPTSPTTSSIFPRTLAIPQRFDTNPLIIAGTTSPLFLEIKYSTTIEPMIIDEVSLRVSRDNIQDWVSDFALYDENGNFVASTTSNYGRLVTFDGLNITRDPGSHRFYVALRARSTDDMYGPSAINFALSLQTISAEGVYSRRDTSPNTSTNNNATNVTISPVGIESVQFLDTRNGYRTDSFLSNGENTLGILEITTPVVQSRYQQDLVLDTLQVEVLDNTVSRQIAYNLRIERLDNQSSTSIAGNVQGNIVTFSLNSLGTSSIVEQGQTAVFRLSVVPSLDSNSRESVQLSVRNLKSGGITYHVNGSNESITTIQQWEWEIFGPRVSD